MAIENPYSLRNVDKTTYEPLLIADAIKKTGHMVYNGLRDRTDIIWRGRGITGEAMRALWQIPAIVTVFEVQALIGDIDLTDKALNGLEDVVRITQRLKTTYPDLSDDIDELRDAIVALRERFPQGADIKMLPNEE
jgi:hypothetical protein